MISAVSHAQSTTPSGTVIRNTAAVAYTDGGGAAKAISTNEVASLVQPLPTRSTIALLRAAQSNPTVSEPVGPTQCRGANGFTTLPAPALIGGTKVNTAQLLGLITTSAVHGNEPVFVQLDDPDQNVDANVIDTVQLTVTSDAGDSETLRLSETGPNTGRFVGYIQTAAGAAVSGDCVLQVARNESIKSLYVDAHDSQDASQASALVDPYGVVFDSRTGTPINGVRVRLVDAATGQPAAVVGDDGVSNFPSEVVTGSNATDSGGTVYSLPAGVFRFPLVTPGNYRLEVVAPSGHAFPSTMTMQELSVTPGAPFRLSDGSFGKAFVAAAPPAVAVDVPLDPLSSQLFLQKSTVTTVASVGDFIQYTLTVENVATAGTFPAVTTVDQMPAGMRYRKGSARLNGRPFPDPSIAPDGRTLTFTTGALPAGQHATITYVTEVTVEAHGRQLVNSARALGVDGTQSNEARAIVQLKEEIFSEHAFVAGRVVEGDCNRNTSELKGVAGVRVYLEDGRYSVTDEEGKYHFEGVLPGSHVVQLDPVTVPETHTVQECSDQVRHAGRAYSQFLDVRGGSLWRADFLLERKPTPTGSVALDLASALGNKEDLTHTAVVHVAKLPIQHASVMVMLADGLEYEPKSAELDGRALDEPEVASGVATFSLGDLAANSEHKLTFRTRVDAAASGALAVKALVSFEGANHSRIATAPVETSALRGEMQYEHQEYRFAPHFGVLETEMTARDRAQLDSIASDWQGVRKVRLKVVGHTDRTPIAAKDRALYPDNYALSQTRAEAVANYLRERLSVDPAYAVIEGHGSDEPIPGGSDADNRRVDISIEGVRVKGAGALTMRRADATGTPIATAGVLAQVAEKHVTAPAVAQGAKADTRVHIDVETLEPKLDWLIPRDNDNPPVRSTHVVIAHLADQSLELLVNGAAVSPLNFEGVQVNRAKTVAYSYWRGIELREGRNDFVAVVRDASGKEITRLQRTVHFGGGAVRAQLEREASTLVADGKTHPVVAFRMFDAEGKPARPGTMGAYRVDPPYRTWWEVQSLDDNKLLQVGDREPTFTVDSDGIARLELEPTTSAGNAVLHFKFNERSQQDVRVWLEPRAREWVMVGLAEGTAAYKTLADNMEVAKDAGFEDGYSQDGRVAFFAKGAVKGEYLLTLAYDSDREHTDAKQRLLGVIEPSRYYTLYGDATEQRMEAPSTRKLYLKLERRQFAALFGDYETGLTVTELTRYSRTMTGLKADYSGDRYAYTAFASQSDQGYVKDELLGDGTSGLYRLSRKPLIINSDKVRLEVRDRFRSEVVLETRELTRYIDYDVDYLNGTIFFKQPVMSRDENFNPQYIVAEYEVSNGGKEEITAGGRAAVKLAHDKIEAGASFIQEGAASGDTRVAGTDFRWRLTPATEVKAELARSESEDPLRPDHSDAYLAQLSHINERSDVRAYVREQDAGFGVGQQMSSEAGTRKYGADGTFRINRDWSVRGEAFRQEMLTTGADRDLASTEVHKQSADYTFGGGARYVADTNLATGDVKSEQAFVNGTLDLFHDRITLKAGQDLSLASASASPDYPSRTTLGIDYHYTAATTFFADYEHGEGGALTTDMTRFGVRMAPWSRAQIVSSLNQQNTENGARVFSQLGLTQGWQMNDHWSFDFGLDQNRTIRGPDFAPLNANAPLASGALTNALDNDFVAAFVGALYRTETWMFTSRLEHRNSDDETRWVYSGGFYREPKSGHAFSVATQYLVSDFNTGTDTEAADVQLSWAYRPATSNWIVLDRLNLKRDYRQDLLSRSDSVRAVENLNANWQLNPRTQLGLQFGGRYVRSTFDDERYNGFSDLYGVDVRRDLTARFDIGAHGALMHSWESGVSTQSFGIDVGFTPVRNIWISIGYNFDGFHDDDFTQSRYTAQGPYLKFRVKADQDTFKDLSLGGTSPLAGEVVRPHG